MAAGENSLYLAQHPANSLYYMGSALVFRAIFAMIADKADGAGFGMGRLRLCEGGEPLSGSAADFAKLIAEETEKWGKVVKFAGLKVD